MAAPLGNNYWSFRKKHGPNFKYDAETLWDDSVKYFEWIDSKPWIKNDVAKAGDHFGEAVKIETQSPYTQKGLCIFLDITEETFRGYTKSDNKDLFEVANKIKMIIEDQQFSGATVGAFKENIIARSLGLADERKLSGDLAIRKQAADLFPPELDED